MSKLTEDKLEQYLRFPEELSSEERDEIKRELKKSPEAQEVLDWLKSFYTELDSMDLPGKSVIPLYPSQPNKIEVGPVALAAMTQTVKSERLITRATLVSKENNSLVRVLENTTDQTLEFHVHSKVRGKNERAILSFVDREIDLVTNEMGKLKTVWDLSDINWNEVSTLLRIPVAKKSFDFSGNSEQIFKHDLGIDQVTVQCSNHRLKLSLNNPVTSITRVLCVHGSKTILKKLSSNETSFSLNGDSKVHLFFYE